MWFDTPAEYQDSMNESLEPLSESGKKMNYFYNSLKGLKFITNFDSLAYTEKNRPYHKSFISKDEDYLIFSKHGENDVDNGDFTYRVNKYGFRSNKFNKLDSNNFNILAVGCSVTFGMAMPEENIWPTRLKRKIQETTTKNVNMDNIGLSGIDTFQTLQNVYVYVEKFGKPDYIFAHLPPIYRKPHPESPYGRITTKQKIHFLVNSEEIEDYLLAYWEEELLSFYQNILAIRAFEMYCKHTGIKLIWSSWCISSREYYRFFEFENFVDLLVPYKDFNTECKTDLDKKYWKIARDRAHAGSQEHLIYTDLFYTEWMKNEVQDTV